MTKNFIKTLTKIFIVVAIVYISFKYFSLECAIIILAFISAAGFINSLIVEKQLREMQEKDNK